MSEAVRKEGPRSVSLLLARFLRGSRSAFNGLVARYTKKVSADARHRMGSHLAKATDGEDIASAAFLELWKCRRSERKEPLRLDDRNSLLALLAELTAQETRRLDKEHTRQKRDVRRTLRPSDLYGQEEDIPDLSQLSGREPPPEWVLQFNETVTAWLGELPPRQQQIVKKRLEGYSQLEIALILGCSLRAIEREISAVKSAWRRAGRVENTNWQDA